MKISLMPLKKFSDSKLIPLFQWPNAESVNTFKNLIDSHFVHIMYETDFL